MLVNVLVQAGGTNEASVFNHFTYGMEDNQASGCGINGAAWFSQSCRPPKQDLQEQLYQLQEQFWFNPIANLLQNIAFMFQLPQMILEG